MNNIANNTAARAAADDAACGILEALQTGGSIAPCRDGREAVAFILEKGNVWLAIQALDSPAPDVGVGEVGLVADAVLIRQDGEAAAFLLAYHAKSLSLGHAGKLLALVAQKGGGEHGEFAGRFRQALTRLEANLLGAVLAR